MKHVEYFCWPWNRILCETPGSGRDKQKTNVLINSHVISDVLNKKEKKIENPNMSGITSNVFMYRLNAI